MTNNERTPFMPSTATPGEIITGESNGIISYSVTAVQSNSLEASVSSCLGMLLIKLYAFEGFIEIISLINSTLLAGVLIQAKSVHLHLRLACLSMCICIILRALMRFLLIADYFSCNTLYSSTTQFWLIFALGLFNVGSHFVEISIVIERMVSNIKTRNYETWFSAYFISLICFSPYVLSFICSVLVLYLKLVGIMPANYIVLALLIIAWVSFFIVLRIQFSSSINSSHNATLSERFQYYENIRTNRTMVFLCIFCVCHIAIATVFQTIRGIIIGSAPPEQSVFLGKLFECILHIIYGTVFAMFPLTFILTIPAIKKRYSFKIFGFCTSGNSRISPEGNFVILSVTGKQLAHESTPKEHFLSLRQAWDCDWEEKEKKMSSILC